MFKFIKSEYLEIANQMLIVKNNKKDYNLWKVFQE
jgi:uncharacterized protein YbdZ (MbtH family)